MALTCGVTYDVDPHLLYPLIELDDDVAVMIECAITVNDRRPANGHGLPNMMKLLLQQYQRLSSVVEPIL